LPKKSLAEVNMVSLSTTLTTNSVVEDLGAPVCVLLPGYSSEQVKQSGLLEILPAQFVVRLEGGYDAVGREHRPLDEAAGQEAIERLKNQVSAFAISSMFGTRNLRPRTGVEPGRAAARADRGAECAHGAADQGVDRLGAENPETP
jgi:N-methylhydantoinase A/oxoprolinase/acetone carboxylase beta subunit